MKSLHIIFMVLDAVLLNFVNFSAEYSRMILFYNGNWRPKRGLFHCMSLMFKTCMCRTRKVHLSL